jgi:hypothetical protein
MTQDAPLSEAEFNELARTGHLVLPADRDNVAIHTYLTRVRGWDFVWTNRFPEDMGGARIEINAKFD